MKKFLFIASMMLATVCAQAQLKVTEDGKVGIQMGNMNIASDFCIGFTGTNYQKMALRFTDSGIYSFRTGTPQYNSQWLQSVYGRNIAVADRMNVGIEGTAQGNGTLNSGRAYGILGKASNTTSGYNYGAFGSLIGTQNGAGIYGTTQSDNGVDTGGRYAGYFNGDVKVTGSLYASVLTSTAASASNATSQIAVANNEVNDVNVSDKLSQLSAIQYNLEMPTVLASSMTFSPRNISDTLSTMTLEDTVEVAYPSDIELQALEKNHYGLMAVQLQQVYPDLVYENQHGELCINYIEMIPLLVESIKELKAEINTLQSGNNGGAVVMSRAIGGATNIEETTALTIPVLKQNNPNPFTENTVIEYSLPETVLTANIYIYDMNGKQIQQITLTERGNSSVTISGGELNAGMYLYSLIADGQVVDTKRMILTK